VKPPMWARRPPRQSWRLPPRSEPSPGSVSRAPTARWRNRACVGAELPGVRPRSPVFGAIACPSNRQAGRTTQWIGEAHATMEALLLRREFEVAPAVCAPDSPAVGWVPVHVYVHVQERADSGSP
jgi:hypothetical protein